LLAPEQVAEMRKRREQGVLIKTLMKDYGLGKTSVYHYLGGAWHGGSTKPSEPSRMPE
jgi:hypothetical protein